MNCCRGRGKPETLSRADRSAAAGRLRPIGRALFVVFVTQLHQLGSRIGSARAASPSSTALSLSQNRASRVSRATILSHAGRLPMHRSTAIALSGTGCKQCDRPAARITIGRIGIAVHRIICGFDIAGFTSALRSITEVQRTSCRGGVWGHAVGARFELATFRLNLRPSRYEPYELPGCSTPR